jgi:DNA-binding transcriptional MerR regulator
MDLASSEAAWTIAAVSERAGISKATLRVWDVRYGLSPSATTAGGHRRYSAADVETLLAVRHLTEQGVPAGDAARSVLAGRAEPALGLPPGSTSGAHRLGRAAMRLDGPACAAVVREELRAAGVTETWESVLRPVLRAVALQAEMSALGVAVEHVVSHIATVALAEGAPTTERASTPPVLLACSPGELHELPMSALAAGLAARGQEATLIGARTPTTALTDAVRQTGAGVVVVFSLLAECADPQVPARLAQQTTVLAAGPGWSGADLPAGVGRVDGLAATLAAVCDPAGS